MTTNTAPSPSARPRHPGGRPAKFKEPCKVVTVTLPARILDLLGTVDTDRAKAITKVVEALLVPPGNSHKPIDFIELPDAKKLIVIANSPSLRTLPWLHLVELAPARHLICLDHGIPSEKLELAIFDLLEASPQAPDARLLAELLSSLRIPRRSQAIARGDILFIDA